MQLIFLNTLKSISGYTDVRSVRTWLAGMNLTLLHIGKNYAVNKELFEKTITKRYSITKQHSGYQPKQETEKTFLAEINHLLSERTEL